MIYLFNGITGILSFPGYLCSTIGQGFKSCGSFLCGGACKGVCKSISKFFDNIGNEIKYFFQRPLSAYVVLSCIVSGITLYLANEDGRNPNKECDSNFLLILGGFSLVNIFFAIYVQVAVWRKIMTPENRAQFIDGDMPGQLYSGGLGPYTRQATQIQAATYSTGKPAGKKKGAKIEKVEKFSRHPGKAIIPTKVVQGAFKEVFMEDLVVLVMFFALLVVFFLSWKGPELVDSGSNLCQVQETTKGY